MTRSDAEDDVEYRLEMIHEASTETGFRILSQLRDRGEVSPTALAETLGMKKNTLQYHVNKLSDAGLVVNRKRDQQGEDGYYSYYVATPLGERAVDLVTEFVEEDALDQHPRAGEREGLREELAVSKSRTAINNSVAAVEVEQTTSDALKRQSGEGNSSGPLPDA